MKKFPSKIEGILFIIFFLGLVVILTLVVQRSVTDKAFYEIQYNKLNVKSGIGISQEELMGATDALLNYIEGKRTDINFTAEIKGEKREVFNEREKLHMIDVKNLYQGMIRVRITLTIIICALATALGQIASGKINRKSLGKSFLTAGVFLFLIVGGLSLWAYKDFYGFWMNFHRLFFTNDLFLLDPAKDIMINMVSEDFFYALVFKVVKIYIIIIGISTALAIYAILSQPGKGFEKEKGLL